MADLETVLYRVDPDCPPGYSFARREEGNIIVRVGTAEALAKLAPEDVYKLIKSLELAGG